MLSGWMQAVMHDWLTPPPPYPQQDWMEKYYGDPDLPLDPRIQHMTTVEIAKEWFDDPRFQMLFIRLQGMMGNWPDKALAPAMAYLIGGYALGFTGAGYWEGGTHQIVHVLQRIIGDLGGVSYVDHEVDEIIVENGVAKGIRLKDGSQIEAKKFVVTNVDPRQLAFRFLRNFPISDLVKKKLRNLIGDAATLFWGHIAHHEKPQYIADEFSPGIGDYFGVVMGDNDVDYLDKHYRYHNQTITPGNWPDKMYFWVCPIDVFDERMAPEGKHTTLVEELGPPASSLTERQWHQLRREIGPRMVKEWSKFAPNMTEDNIIGYGVDTPGDFERRDSPCVEGSWQMGVSPIMQQWGRYRPIPEFAQYKVPGISNLYCTGIGWHSNFGSPAGFAYNMYKQCAWDHGLREFWKEAGRDF